MSKPHLNVNRTSSNALAIMIINAIEQGEPSDWIEFYLMMDRLVRWFDEAQDKGKQYVARMNQVRAARIMLDDLDDLIPPRLRESALSAYTNGRDPSMIAHELTDKGELIPYKGVYSDNTGRLVGMVFTKRGKYHFRLLRPYVELRGPYPTPEAARFNIEAVMGGDCSWEPRYTDL